MVNIAVVLSDGRTISGQADTFLQAVERVQIWAHDPWYTHVGGPYMVYVAFGRPASEEKDIDRRPNHAARLVVRRKKALFEGNVVGKDFPEFIPAGYGLLARRELTGDLDREEEVMPIK